MIEQVVALARIGLFNPRQLNAESLDRLDLERPTKASISSCRP